MTDQRCPTCGQRVRVTGDTTLHYEGVDAAENVRLRAEVADAKGALGPETHRVSGGTTGFYRSLEDNS